MGRLFKVNNIIELTGVCLRREGRELLTDLDWTVKRGENWAVLGPSGAGKSLLLQILSGSLWPSAGAARLFGQLLGEIELRDLQVRIGIVSAAVKEWLERYHGYRPVWQVIEGRSEGLFGIRAVAAGPETRRLLAEGRLEDLAGRAFEGLSQGEKQKVLIARALRGNPELLLLDEPAAGLDLAAREEVVDLLDRLRRASDLTVVQVSHHLEELPTLIDRALLLREGRILVAGGKEEVLQPESLQRTYGVSLAITWDKGRIWPRVSSEGRDGVPWP